MNTFNHLFIASVIKKYAEEELSVKLDTRGFLLGNIKPDLAPSLIKIPHFKADSISFVKLEMEKLLTNEITQNSKCSKSFSERLGIITHYLSDYFCYAHSKDFKGGNIYHYYYEVLLLNYCRNNVRKLASVLKPNKWRCSFAKDFKTICINLEDTHKQYLSFKPSCELDMSFTLNICAYIVISILRGCMKKEATAAA